MTLHATAPPVTRVLDRFSLAGRTAVITGGAGVLGRAHAEAILEAGGTAILADIHGERAESVAALVAQARGRKPGEPPAALGVALDVTSRDSVESLLDAVLRSYGHVDILVNNAAKNPKMERGTASPSWDRFEAMTLEQWNGEIAVTLTGAFLCSQVLGSEMARAGRGVIVNIASDLALIAPDQRLYRQPGLADDEQPVKPVTYSVAKTGLLGLTRYLATYWAHRGVRANALCPGGVFNQQPPDFVARLCALIPMGRMADLDEYKGALVFLCSDASSYMTGTTLVMEGGRTAW